MTGGIESRRLNGKVAIITGASRGIGRELAGALAESGARVVLAARDLPLLEEVAKGLGSMGVQTLTVQTDVTVKRDVDAMVSATLARWQRIDILVNNAGVNAPGASEDLAEEEFDRCMAVNVKGVFLCSQAVGRVMLRQGSGSIINIASVAGLVGFPKRAAYGTSKAAVVMLTKILAVEWAKRGVRVNAVAPGVYRTPMNEEMIAKGHLNLELIERRIPMGRRGELPELFGVLRFLASDDSRYVTGETIAVDGGWVAYGFL